MEAAKIEKRIAKERPCRVLFIRNVKVSYTIMEPEAWNQPFAEASVLSLSI